jgi:hypothetical protein
MGEKGLGQGGDQKPDGHYDIVSEFLFLDGRNFRKDNYLCNTPTIRSLW